MNFPSGFSLREIRFYQPNTEKEFSLQRVDLDINLLSLLTGSLAADVQIKSKEGSNLDLSFVSNGFSPAAAESPLSQLSLNAQDFDFSQLMNFTARYQGLVSRNMAVALLAEVTTHKGKLNGSLELKRMDSTTDAYGNFDLSLNELSLQHPAIGAKQDFKPIHLKAEINQVLCSLIRLWS